MLQIYVAEPSTSSASLHEVIGNFRAKLLAWLHPGVTAGFGAHLLAARYRDKSSAYVKHALWIPALMPGSLSLSCPKTFQFVQDRVIRKRKIR